jgi:UDP-N-acetyl-D-glucosamine dehydrogenase
MSEKTVEEILEKIESWNWGAAVVGLGYVGLPLVLTMARAGIDVTGFDISAGVVERLSSGRSHVDDVTDDDLAEVAGRTAFTTDIREAATRDVFFICVPTPLSMGKQPDMSYVEGAARAVASVLRPGHTVILESTTYPGTTENVVRPILESASLTLDEDFLLAYSPERVDPGNASFRTPNIPRVVGGASEQSSRAAAAIYRRFVEKVHVVSNARTAEMAKLLENTFRWVNIALVNEMSFIARAIGVDVWEVIEAAATKPFGYMPFYPGPGVGGHCIPLDPFYLAWAARMTGEGTRFVELAETINARMPRVVLERVQEALNEQGRSLRGARVLVLGVAFKPNVRDYRESPALDCMRLLEQWGADVRYADPLVPEVARSGIHLTATPLTPDEVASSDCVLILCDHDDVDYGMVVEKAPVVVDTRNALGRRGLRAPNVRSL